MTLIKTEVEICGRKSVVYHPAGMEEVTFTALRGSDYPIVLPSGYEPKIIVDVGGNVGGTCLYFHNRFPGAKIFAFEPDPDTFSLLQRNVAAYPAINVFPWGLLDRSALLPLYQGANFCAQNSLWRTPITSDIAKTARVERASAALFDLGLSEISILKIDAEGAEWPILRDLVESANRFTIDQIQLEYHSEEDRVAIDRLLESMYFLASSNSTKIHRGRVVYARKALFQDEDFFYRIPVQAPR